MATTKLLRTQKTYTAAQGQPLHKTGEKKEVVEVEMSLTISVPFTLLTYDPPSSPPSYEGLNKRIAGTKAATQRSTQPKESRSSVTKADKTPSARAKVLPWVQGIETDDPPDGMFGPYPSRPVSMVEAPAAAPRTRHPFAHTSIPTMPFAALGTGHRGDDEQRTEHLASQRPEPGGWWSGPVAGLPRTPGGLRGGAGGSVNRYSEGSPGMGTFGLGVEGTVDPGQIPLPKSQHAATKMQYTVRKPPPSEHISPGPVLPPKPAEPPQIKPESDEQVEELEQPAAHLHRPHHEHPFSHAQAHAKQTEALGEAMKEARAAALAQLEAAQNQQEELEIARERAALLAAGVGGPKGPRQTFETGTSVPSFGHIFHADGMPLSARPSMQVAPGGFDPFRIPFGVPLGMNLPRGLMVLDEGGIGMGLSLGPEVLDIHEGPSRRMDDRSAFVETVEDEEDPTVHTASPTAAAANAARSTAHSIAPPDIRARTASGLLGEETLPLGSVVGQSVQASRQGSPLAPASAYIPPGSRAPTVLPTKARSDRAPTVVKEASGAPTVISERQTLITEPGRRTVASQVRTKNTPDIIPRTPGEEEDEMVASVAPSLRESIAPTTISNVKRLVAESQFHDETLCQLLDAARLNLIGHEAKKALQRAARARVIELRDLRGGEMPNTGVLPELSPPRKDKKAKSRDRQKKRSGSAKSERVETAEGSEPPFWAQEIISRLSDFDARLVQLDSQKREQPLPVDQGRPLTQHTQMSHNVPSTMIDELIFNELPSSGFTQGIHMPMGLTSSILFPKGTSQNGHVAPSVMAPPPGATAPSQYSQRAPTQAAHSVARTERPAQAPTNDVTRDEPINWGSEVELPQMGDNVSPPKPITMTIAPTINVLAPTESNLGAGKPSTRAPSPSVRSRAASRAATERLPDEVEVKVITEEVLPEPALPAPQERDLPPPPSESVRSHRPSPPPKSTPLEARTAEAARSIAGPAGTQYPSHSAYKTNPYDYHPPPIASVVGSRAPPPIAKSVVMTQTSNMTPPQPQAESAAQLRTPPRDRIHVHDPLFQSPEGWRPWDRIQQRLYDWAMIVEEKSFVRALEDVSLGRQVESFPLSVFLMMTFKRLIRRNLSETPAVPCDKLFVPPFMADNINTAVHHRNYDQAREILVDLWNSIGSAEPPRVIISLTKVRDDPDQWSAHRYDLVTNHLSTYKVSHLQDPGVDGRPFHWWQVIRQAWPQHQIPPMEELERTGTAEKIITTRVMPEHRHDNALYTANISRNLLLGYRPERDQDLTKLRELVWAEVKRLLGKKRQGKLVVIPDSPEHLYDV